MWCNILEATYLFPPGCQQTQRDFAGFASPAGSQTMEDVYSHLTTQWSSSRGLLNNAQFLKLKTDFKVEIRLIVLGAMFSAVALQAAAYKHW